VESHAGEVVRAWRSTVRPIHSRLMPPATRIRVVERSSVNQPSPPICLEGVAVCGDALPLFIVEWI
jgi:hypothetical protein